MKTDIVRDSYNTREEFDIHILRIIACILVVIIHTCAISITQNETWNALNLFDSFSRCSVPIFFMISGYLMLGKDYDTIKFYKKRAIRILPPFIFFSALFFILSGNGYNILKFLSNLLNDKIYSHFWFMYAITGIYILFPFINSSWKNITRKDKHILISIFFIGAIYNLTGNRFFSLMGIDISCMWYFLLGAYLKGVKLDRTLNMSLYILSSITVFFLTYNYYSENGSFSEKFYSYTHPLIIIQAISLFLFINSNRNHTNKYKNTIKLISSLSFGIYLIHPIFIIGLDKLGYTNSFINPWIAIPVKAILCYIASLICIYCMHKIKLLRLVSGS